MALVKIQGVSGGYKAVPADTDTLEIQETSNGGSYYVTVDGIRLGVSKSLIVAVSDETTALTVGDGKLTFRMPWAFTLTSIRASVNTAPTGTDIIIDVTEGGTSLYTTTLLHIDAGDKTSVGSATTPNLTDTALADDAEISIDITQIGSGGAGAGLKVTLIGTKT